MKILLCFILLTSLSTSSATAQFFEKDTIPKEEYKLTRAEFLEKHADDSVTTAMVHLFYNKRRNGMIKLAFLPTPIILGGVGLIIDTQGPSHYVIPIATVVLGGTSALIIMPVIISGIHQTNNYSRRELYLLIEDYKNGQAIPKKLHRKLGRQIRKL